MSLCGDPSIELVQQGLRRGAPLSSVSDASRLVQSSPVRVGQEADELG